MTRLLLRLAISTLLVETADILASALFVQRYGTLLVAVPMILLATGGIMVSLAYWLHKYTRDLVGSATRDGLAAERPAR